MSKAIEEGVYQYLVEAEKSTAEKFLSMKVHLLFMRSPSVVASLTAQIIS